VSLKRGLLFPNKFLHGIGRKGGFGVREGLGQKHGWTILVPKKISLVSDRDLGEGMAECWWIRDKSKLKAEYF